MHFPRYIAACDCDIALDPDLGVRVYAMPMQQNTIGAGIVGERIDNRASARERWSASLGMPVWLPVPAVQIPRYCVSDVQHLMGESATNKN